MGLQEKQGFIAAERSKPGVLARVLTVDGECELPFHPGYIHTLYSVNIVIMKLANCDPVSNLHLTQNMYIIYSVKYFESVLSHHYGPGFIEC